MLFSAARGLLVHALPILIAQLSSIGMMVVDTAVLGHVSAVDLAAVAIGGGIHVSVVFALVGILQAVAPVVAHLHGGRRDDEVRHVLQQGFWLALALSVPGIVFLTHPGILLDRVAMDVAVNAKVRSYLSLLAWGLPAALCYRTFYAFCNALGKPRVLMGIGVASLGLHALLARGLALDGWLGEPLGVVGCAMSNIAIAWLACLSGAAYLALGPLGRRYQPFVNWVAPRWKSWRELLHLGLPMGLSNLVEISSFTLVSLFVAPLGATVVAGHRIIANLSALTYMLPLSLAIATMVAVGQALGGRDRQQANAAMQAGIALSAVMSLLASAALWLAAEPLFTLYTDDVEVRSVARGLIAFLIAYQFFDALQTVAGHVLRAYRITFLPMLVQTFCFWGVGLLGGAWLCYQSIPPMGVAGFWLASVISLFLAAVFLVQLLKKAMQMSQPPL